MMKEKYNINYVYYFTENRAAEKQVQLKLLKTIQIEQLLKFHYLN